MSFPYEIDVINGEDGKDLFTYLPKELQSFIKIGPKEYVNYHNYREFAADLYNFKVRPDDIWICTMPRSGTTLTQEMMWMVATNLDFETAKQLPLLVRFPQIEQHTLSTPELNAKIIDDLGGNPEAKGFLDMAQESLVPMLDAMPSPRFIKTHCPLSLLPPNLLDTCKVVYVCRHPKDVIVSYYHFAKILRTLNFNGDFATFYDLFERGLIGYGPYWAHVAEAWEKRENPNLLFLFYEDTVKDMRKTIVRLSKHLGKDMNEEDIEKLLDHLHVDTFRKNESVNLDVIGFMLKHEDDNTFIRKGKSGGWKDYFTPELNARADKWIAENVAKIPGFSFPQY